MYVFETVARAKKRPRFAEWIQVVCECECVRECEHACECECECECEREYECECDNYVNRLILKGRAFTTQ